MTCAQAGISVLTLQGRDDVLKVGEPAGFMIPLPSAGDDAVPLIRPHRPEDVPAFHLNDIKLFPETIAVIVVAVRVAHTEQQLSGAECIAEVWREVPVPRQHPWGAVEWHHERAPILRTTATDGHSKSDSIGTPPVQRVASLLRGRQVP